MSPPPNGMANHCRLLLYEGSNMWAFTAFVLFLLIMSQVLMEFMECFKQILISSCLLYIKYPNGTKLV